MKLLVVAAACLSAALASPGGYIYKGGVVDFKRPLDYKAAAESAGRFAWAKEYEAEFERTGLLASNDAKKRETGHYVPTFFTTQENHDALTASIPQGSRVKKNSQYNSPLYYDTYHNSPLYYD